MINGSQTGKRQSSYRHNIHVNCWYNVSVTLGNQEDVHDDVLSILLLLLKILEYSPLAQSKLSSCYHMSQQKKPLIVSELFSRKCRLTTKCIDLECHLFVFFFVYSKDHFVIWSKHWICLLELLLHRNKCIDCFS